MVKTGRMGMGTGECRMKKVGADLTHGRGWEGSMGLSGMDVDMWMVTEHYQRYLVWIYDMPVHIG